MKLCEFPFWPIPVNHTRNSERMRNLKTNDDAERRTTAQFPHALSIDLYYSRQCNNSWWNIQLIYSLVSNLGNRFHTMHIDPYHCVSKFRQRIFKPVIFLNFKNMKRIKCSVVKHSFILYHLFTFGNSSPFLQRESEQKLSQVTLSIFFFPVVEYPVIVCRNVSM